MGICESNLNTKRLNLEHFTKNKNQHINSPQKAFLNNNIKENQNRTNSYLINNIKNSKININLQKYEPSLDTNNSNIIQSDINSKSKEEELIIKGKVNLNCQNKENDFDNESFMNLIKSKGGVVLKEEVIDKKEINNQKANEIMFDFEKDDISEIKSQSSLSGISQNKDTVLIANNGKKYKNELKSEMSKGKLTDYSLAHNKLNLGINNPYDKRTKNTTNTTRPKINFNKYLNGIFSNDYNTYNNNNQIQNNNNKLIYNPKGFNIPFDNIKKPENNCINRRFQNSLISNYNNRTNDTINEELTGSFISVPKNDEKIPEFFFNMNGNAEDIISNISSH